MLLIIPGKNYSQDQTPQNYYIGFSHNIFFNTNTQDATAVVELLTSKFVNRTGLSFETEVKIFDNLSLLNDYVTNDEIHLVTLLSTEYLKIKNSVQIYPFGVPLINDKHIDKLLLLVKKGEKLESLNDLRNKNIIVQANGTKENSLAFIWLDTMLLKNFGETHKTFFNDVKIQGKAANIVLPVFFNNVDACIVLNNIFETLAELNPQLKHQLVPITVSQEYLITIMCKSKTVMNNEDYDHSTNRLLEFHESTEGRQIFTIFKIKKVIPFEDKYLESVSQLFNDYTYLTNK